MTKGSGKCDRDRSRFLYRNKDSRIPNLILSDPNSRPKYRMVSTLELEQSIRGTWTERRRQFTYDYCHRWGTSVTFIIYIYHSPDYAFFLNRIKDRVSSHNLFTIDLYIFNLVLDRNSRLFLCVTIRPSLDSLVDTVSIIRGSIDQERSESFNVKHREYEPTPVRTEYPVQVSYSS